MDISRIAEEEGVNAEKVRKTLEFCKEKHEGQERIRGGAYHNHPIRVAEIVSEFHCDTPTICAALLHDTVEDTDATLEKLEEEFGEEVAFLVDGLTEDKSIDDKWERKKNARDRLLQFGEEDRRIFLIKFADRIHNLKSIEVKGEERARSYVDATKKFFIPLAESLDREEIAEEMERECKALLERLG